MIVKCILYIIYSVAIYPRYFRRESVIRPRIEYSFEGFGVLTKFNHRFLNDYASIKLTSFFSVRRFYPLHVIFHWNKREREKEGGRRPESMATSVSSPADGERNLSVEKRGGFERNRVNNQTARNVEIAFSFPPICARKLRVLFMSYRVFTVSAIYGRSSFSSYYRWHPRPARPPPSTSGVRRSIQFCRK